MKRQKHRINKANKAAGIKLTPVAVPVQASAVDAPQAAKAPPVVASVGPAKTDIDKNTSKPAAPVAPVSSVSMVSGPRSAGIRITPPQARLHADAVSAPPKPTAVPHHEDRTAPEPAKAPEHGKAAESDRASAKPEAMPNTAGVEVKVEHVNIEVAQEALQRAVVLSQKALDSMRHEYNLANQRAESLQSDLDSMRHEYNLACQRTEAAELSAEQILARLDQQFHAVHLTVGQIYAEHERMRRELGWVAYSLDHLSKRPASSLAYLAAGINRLLAPLTPRPVSLRPLADVEEGGVQPDGSVTWHFTGTDPHFALSAQYISGLRPGHYALSFELPKGTKGFEEPKLYFNTGNGYSEAEVAYLRPRQISPTRYIATFRVDRTVRELRFDPCATTGTLVLGQVQLRRPMLKRLALAPIYGVRTVVSKVGNAVWSAMPLQPHKRAALRNWLFTHLGFLFAYSATYKEWAQMAASGAIILKPKTSFVPLLSRTEPLAETPVKLIAFYLPQFHAIPENDEWWGKGFTEWTNVKPAKPKFEGHYQPHVPGELGYYNLLNPKVQERQAELAKQYGVGGFCFYFYWFAGKRLLEAPIENYLNNQNIDFPFCLCWANENWSRRWDGLDSELLISQKHSPEDDLAFIAYIAKYLRDPRYIRVDGKPLLMIYRPSDLPEAKKTVERWRTWCRENGIGEIYLGYTQSFERVDPALYGLDAAIEFPPNNSSPPDITNAVTPLHDKFEGRVYDWTSFVRRSESYETPAYKLFRGVCPSWDNTARRKTKGFIQANTAPVGYQNWLRNAIHDTVRRFTDKSERLVFVNAWNEWAEGAHLEPDQRYGYAWLEATRQAMLCTTTEALLLDNRQHQDKLAVIIHAFYSDVLAEIVAKLAHLDRADYKIFVTCPTAKQAEMQAVLKDCGADTVLLPMKNHGRDVLPFLSAVRQAFAEGYDTILKVHTKKSKHRADGDAWRAELYDSLMSSERVQRARDTFKSDPTVGLIGPAGHITPFSYYWGMNAGTTEALAERMGVDTGVISGLRFIAGTMFYARKEALMPILDLAITEADFEPEKGLVDGTFAHALERAFALSARAVGLRILDTDGIDCTTIDSSPMLEDYKYAERTNPDDLAALMGTS